MHLLDAPPSCLAFHSLVHTRPVWGVFMEVWGTCELEVHASSIENPGPVAQSLGAIQFGSTTLLRIHIHFFAKCFQASCSHCGVPVQVKEGENV